MFTWLYESLGTMLSWFSQLFNGKYAFALFLYALLFKLIFLPFAVKQRKSQIAMMSLTPKIERIQAKYKGRSDEASLRRQQQELVELQRKEGVKPLSGCLPLLLQLPIITFLYNVIRHPLSYICKLTGAEIERIKVIISGAGLVAADEIGLIANIHTLGLETFEGIDLTALPDFTLLGTNLALTPSISEPSLLWLIPILAAVLTWVSSFLIRRWSNPSASQDIQDILDRYQTKRRNLYVTGPAALSIAKKFSVHRLCDKDGNRNLANQFVEELVEQLIRDGRLVTAETKNGLGIRTVAGAEIRQKDEPLPGQQQMTL